MKEARWPGMISIRCDRFAAFFFAGALAEMRGPAHFWAPGEWRELVVSLLASAFVEGGPRRGMCTRRVYGVRLSRLPCQD